MTNPTVSERWSDPGEGYAEPERAALDALTGADLWRLMAADGIVPLICTAPGCWGAPGPEGGHLALVHGDNVGAPQWLHDYVARRAGQGTVTGEEAP